MHLTAEQDAIASCTAKTLVVNAFAGTGKTSTLVEYARRRPNESLLYLAFNRTTKEEALQKFPKNVKCVTTHGLAYSSHGHKYSSKLGNPRATHLSPALGVDFISAGLALQVVNNFLVSSSQKITEVHALTSAQTLPQNQICILVDLANRAWSMMQDLSNKAVPMPHDGYLKLYQLSKPQIKTGIILFDEAQDANPVTLEIVLNQNANKVFVGDKYQAIYGFRGSIDALDNIGADANLVLTASFRFGEGAAAVASALLQDWQGCEHMIIGKGKQQTSFAVDQGKSHAIISRTNACLFSESVNLVRSDMPFRFIGGVDGYQFDKILDTYYLQSGQKARVRDKFLGSFDDYTHMREYADDLDDKEIKALLRVVEEYRNDVPVLVAEIKSKGNESHSTDAVILATAHKAKGLEFNDVLLTSDYTDLKPKFDQKTKKIALPPPEEINILYVAATRSMRGLSLPASIKEWLMNSGRKYLFAK